MQKYRLGATIGRGAYGKICQVKNLETNNNQLVCKVQTSESTFSTEV